MRSFAIIAIPLRLCEHTLEFPYGYVGGLSDRNGRSYCRKSGTPLLQILHLPLT